ncbi:MAG: FAD-binding oxidoreductase [Tardiphaga sp.]
MPLPDSEHAAFLRALADIIGEKYVRTGADAAPYEQDWRARYRGVAVAVALPATTEDVAAVVRLCGEYRIAIVPQAGNTGLTGGAIVPDGVDGLIVNVSRLNNVHQVDLLNNAMTVGAGCILADLRALADQHDRQFPVLLGSVGSCEIGGLLSTNAGGTGVLRYGNMREQVLGLEVVLPDGRIWNGLKALRKDNTGYDLKQLFIGAEGTLGIVTAAVLKLYPKLAVSATAMVALQRVDQAIALLRELQRVTGGRVEQFELMSRSQLQIVLRHGTTGSPIADDAPWYVLLELADSSPDWNATETMEQALGAAMENGVITDAVIASDQAKAERIWNLRHTISESNKREGFTVSNDTSVPISALPEFIDRVTRRLERLPQAHVAHCGHVGDGNVHVIAIFPYDIGDASAREAAAHEANTIVHQESVACGGSISAEHGIGRMHIDRLPLYMSDVEMDLMRRVKLAIDPERIMNPDKVLRLG